MGKQNINKEVRERIRDEIRERGLITVEEVSSMIEPLYAFDPEASREREIRACSRRILASIRNGAKEREVLAVKKHPGVFANLDTCRDLPTIRSIEEQLNIKYAGLWKTLNRARRRKAELEGQMSMDATGG